MKEKKKLRQMGERKQDHATDAAAKRLLRQWNPTMYQLACALVRSHDWTRTLWLKTFALEQEIKQLKKERQDEQEATEEAG
jgi:hypothetical protein